MLFHPAFQTGHFTVLKARNADGLSGVAAFNHFRMWRDNMSNAQTLCDRIGNKPIGRRNNQQSIAALFVVTDQVSGLLADQRFDAVVEKYIPFRMHMISVVFRQWAHGKFKILMDIKTARFVLFVKMIVAALVDFGVDQTAVDEKLAPGVVAVAREKRMV